MKIGKLQTFYRIIKQETSEDSAGQRSVVYNEIGQVWGQHRELSMSQNSEGDRENPLLQEYIFCYYEPVITAEVFLVDEFNNQYKVLVPSLVNDRSHMKLKVKLITDTSFNIV